MLSVAVLSSCGEYNTVLKSTDYEYKYEAAKGYFAKGQNSRAATLLEELIPILKGTTNAEESAYMLAMTYFNQGDYISASHYFNVYYTTYPRGTAGNRYTWILRNRAWTKPVLTKPLKNCRCLSNIFRPVHVRI